ncbi:hypothetical protein [Teredinibacter waterburyi]|uniref:hypothetical protein n=1 Tax=Teredinibacter waterburyi TaxID=1500538 RepID=UPI00165F6E19|nr:hypothetical protein [Teredinibacter waterburyi]
MNKVLIFLAAFSGICNADIDPLELTWGSYGDVREAISGENRARTVENITLHNDAVDLTKKDIEDLKKIIEFNKKASILVDHVAEEYYRVCVCYSNGSIEYIIKFSDSGFSIIKTRKLIF